MSLQEAWSKHANDLAGLPTPAQRGEALKIWRTTIDMEAHDYADLVLAQPLREQILQAEAEALIHAYLSGYMAHRGWVPEIEARQAAFRLGRAFRDRLRTMGVPIDTLKATLGTVIDGALAKIVALGLENAV